MEKPHVKIEVIYTTSSNKVVGVVYGHPFHPDGTEVITSEVLSRSEKQFETVTHIYDII